MILLALLGCPPQPPDPTEVELGPIEALLDEVTRTVWPGVDTPTGRQIRRVNGFFDGAPTAYWFTGFASRVPADIFLFCREGDDACPFDDQGRVTWDRLVGDPVLARMPGEVEYSPFWLSWVVRVPDDYAPDTLKSVQGIEAARAAGSLVVEPVIFDHGRDVGPDATIMHCLMVLGDTELQRNGEDIPGAPPIPSMYVPIRQGWHKRYRVAFYDFTASEGVFPPDRASESVPWMPSADIFVLFRDCDHGSTSATCQSITAEVGSVSERGVEVDLTGDGDKEDNNNIISGFPRLEPTDPRDKRYSPLWRINKVTVPVENDEAVRLIDSTMDQDDTMAKSPADLRALVDAGLIEEPVPAMEDASVDAVPGNDGKLFFNCPSQVPRGDP